MEEALYDTPMFREFVQLDQGEECLLDERTILGFRHLLDARELSLQILATVNAMLTAYRSPYSAQLPQGPSPVWTATAPRS